MPRPNHPSLEPALVFESLGEALIAVDKGSVIRIYNQAAARLIGVPAREAMNRKVHSVIPNTRLPVVVHSGRPEMNRRHIIGDKTVITSRLPIFDSEGYQVGAVAVFRENAEMIALAEEITDLKETKALLEAIFNSTQDAISVVDNQGLGMLINPAYTRLTGLSADDVLGKPATVDISQGESVHFRVLKDKMPVTGVSMKVGPGRKPVVVDAAPIMVQDRLKGSVAVIHDLSEISRLAEELDQARRRIRNLEAKYEFDDIVGKTPELQNALEQAEKAAPTPATVLLQGESGTGKELFAHAIHQASGRTGQFIRVSCAAISETLLESELFGYAPGAFTGADKKGRKGYFETAHGGTLFLDEIGKVSLRLQAKLLRVLQEKEIVRVGDSRPIPVNTRLIAATNKNLEQAVRRDAFRSDLFYRLNVVPLYIPPLRRRKEDLPELARFLLRKINQEYGRNIRSLAPQALERLNAYHWPGNVRELENVLRRAVISMDISDTLIRPEHMPQLTSSPCQTQWYIPRVNDPPGDLPEKTLLQMKRDWEKGIIKQALEKCGGNRAKTAALLGISLRSLYNKLKEYGLTGASPGKVRQNPASF
ncbi:MAG: sigma-54-dependent Fis family transcriptional regulator [Desulfosalsimonadaceae bacterium]